VKNFTRIAWRIYHWTLDLFIPPRCVVCGKVETWLCDACMKKIPLLTGTICPRCGKPWDQNGLCPMCRLSPLNVAPIRSAFLFEGQLRDAIHALKYRGGHTVAPLLAQRMAEAWKQYDMQSDLLVPVPLYPSRELKRGYNQSTLLAQALGHELDVAVAPDVLVRARNTASQTKLNRQDRRKNVEAAFAWTESMDIAGKHVTLVDDVATTGATLDACATVLLAHKAKVVNAFTLARAQ